MPTSEEYQNELLTINQRVGGQCVRSNYWATDHDIFSMLTSILQDPQGGLIANIIHPGYSGISPFSGSPDYVNHIRSYIHGGEVPYDQAFNATLPTVMVLNNAGYSKNDFATAMNDDKAKARLKRSKGSHWSLCIHLPVGHFGRAEGTLFYIDSLNRGNAFPQEIAGALVDQANAPFYGAQKEAIFNGQQVGVFGCGFFAAYYAIHLTLTGDPSSLSTAPKDINRHFESRLRGLFQEFTSAAPVFQIKSSVNNQRDLLIDACLKQIDKLEYEEMLDKILCKKSTIQNLLKFEESDSSEALMAKKSLLSLLNKKDSIYSFCNDMCDNEADVCLVGSNGQSRVILTEIRDLLDEFSSEKSKKELMLLFKKLSWKAQELPGGLKSHGTFRRVISERDWSYLVRFPSFFETMDQSFIENVIKDLIPLKDHVDDLIIIQGKENPAKFLNDDLKTKKQSLKHKYDQDTLSKIPEIESRLSEIVNSELIASIEDQLDTINMNCKCIGKAPDEKMTIYYKMAIFRSIEVVGETLKKVIHLPEGIPNLSKLRDRLAHMSEAAKAFILRYDIIPLVADMQALMPKLKKEECECDFSTLRSLIDSFPKASSNKSPLGNEFERFCKEELSRVLREGDINIILKDAIQLIKGGKSKGKDISFSDLKFCCENISSKIQAEEFLIKAFCETILPIIKADFYPGFPTLKKHLENEGLDPEPIINALCETKIKTSKTEERGINQNDLAKMKSGKLSKILKNVSLGDKAKAFVPEGLARSNKMISEMLSKQAKEGLEKFMADLEDLLDPIHLAIDSMGGRVDYPAIFRLMGPVCLYLQTKLQEIGDIANVLVQNQALLSSLDAIDARSIHHKRLVALHLLRNTLSHSFHQLSEVGIQTIVLSLVMQGRGEAKKASQLLEGEGLEMSKILSHSLGASFGYEPVVDESYVDRYSSLIYACAQKYGLSKYVYVLNLSKDKIGPSRGLHLLVAFNEDIEGDLEERYWERDLRLYLFQRDLEDMMSCVVTVDTDDTLSAKVDKCLLLDEEVDQLSPCGELKGAHYIRLDRLRREQVFKRDFNEGRVKEFILPGGERITKESAKFNENEAANAIFSIVFPSEEDYFYAKNAEDDRRKKLLQEPDVKRNLQLKAKAIINTLHRIKPVFFVDEWRRLFDFELQIDRLLGGYFDDNYPLICKAWVTMNRPDSYPLSKRNFLRDVKYDQFALILDKALTAQIQKLIQCWRGAFDVILLKCSQLAAGTDPYLIHQGYRLLRDLTGKNTVRAITVSKVIVEEMFRLFPSVIPYFDRPGGLTSLPTGNKDFLKLTYLCYLKYKRLNFISNYLGVSFDSSEATILDALSRLFVESNEIGGDDLSFSDGSSISVIPLSYEFRGTQSLGGLEDIEHKRLSLANKVRGLHHYLSNASSNSNAALEKIHATEGKHESRKPLDEAFLLVVDDPDFITSQTLRVQGKVVMVPKDENMALYGYLTGYGIPLDCYQYYPDDLEEDNRCFSAVLKMDFEESRLSAIRDRQKYLITEMKQLKEAISSEDHPTALRLMSHQVFLYTQQLDLLRGSEGRLVIGIRKIKTRATRQPFSPIRFFWQPRHCRLEDRRLERFDPPGPAGFT